MGVRSKLFSLKVQAETEKQGQSLLSRFGTQYLLDSVAWALALIVAVFFRYEFVEARIVWLPLLILCAAAAVIQLILGSAYWLYRGRYRYGSFEEVRALLYTVLTVTVLAGLPVIAFGTLLRIPRSAVLIAAPMAFVLMGAVRYLKRLWVDHQSKPGDEAEPTLILGAGYMGGVLVHRMMTDQYSRYLPVGLIDDDWAKRHLRLMGVPVLGTREDISRIAAETEAKVLIIAIARADSSLLREITDAASAAGLDVKVLPVLDEVLDESNELTDVRDVSIEDLIGRHPVDTEVASIAGYLTGKRVMVTGAGGSIGSELCRQIVKYAPAELMMLDRDETGLQVTQISILGRGLLDTKDVILADIRDPEALHAIFAERRPEVVFHTAALKHLPMLEQYPDEGWKTNVLGSLNVLNAAQSVGVTTFVNVSTDKAANPTSALGHSKRVAEKLTAWAAEQTGMKYLSVRFGNVIGSRGSMLPTFQALIESGGPVTVTHPDMTRFFMTIREACQLVIQAGGIGRPGEVLILDMGEPVRILDIAKRMIAQSGKNIDIVYTGLRVGEKLDEELFSEGELDERPFHPKISHASIPVLDPARLDRDEWNRRRALSVPVVAKTTQMKVGAVR